MKKLVLAMGMACAMLGVFGATTVYVDRSADPAAADGTEAHPYVTIQDGVDNVEAGGTVWVGPGVYDQGERADADGASNRVYITKSLTLKATGGRDETVIRGASTPGAATLGLGDQSVRCLAVTNDNNLTVKIYGLTFSGGRSCYRENGNAQNANYSGGVYGNNYSGGTDLYDCRIDDCAATRGGAAYHVRLFRCLVTGCRSSNVGAVGREMRAYHSVFFRNGAQGSSLFAYSLALHSCTVVENGTFCFTSPHEDAYNCILMQNVGGVGSAGFGHIVASVTDDTAALDGDARGNSFGAYGDCVFGPLAGDFRVVKGCACDGTGDVSQLPSAFRDYDYLGNPRLTGDKMNVGAVESSATPVGSLAVGEGFVGATSSEFPPVTCATHLHADRLPASVTLKMPLPAEYNATKGGKGYLMVTNTAGEEVYLDWDDTVALPARPFAADGSSVKYVPVTVNALWVDRENGNDATGTYSAPSNNPYQSLQAAANLLEPNWGEGVIYVRKGRYDNGGSTYYDQTNRLYLAKGRKVRLVAVEGPAVTTIVGGSDSTQETGCGPAAVRCICAAGGTTIVTGFTLTGGRSGHEDPAADDATNNQRKRGGLAYRQYGSGKNLTFFNCEITDCQGEQGSVAYSVNFIRCRIHDGMRSSSLVAQPFVDCTLASTAVWDIGPTEGVAELEVFGSSCTLYNVTSARAPSGP